MYKFNGSTRTIPTKCRADFILPKKDAAEDCGTFYFKSNQTELMETFAGQYAIGVFGSTSDGRRLCLRITEIPVTFEVRVPKGKNISAFKSSLCSFLRSHLKNPDMFMEATEIKAWPGKEYAAVKQDYIRITTHSAWARRDLINALHKREDAVVTSDDNVLPFSYFKNAARQFNLPVSSWAKVVDAVYNEKESSKICSEVYDVKMENFRALVDNMAPDDVRKKQIKEMNKIQEIKVDRSMVVCFDIETRPDVNFGELPLGENKADKCPMICLNAYWKDSKEPLTQICLTTIPCNPMEGMEIVLCSSYEKLIMAFAIIFRQLNPDYVAGFNDAKYDWPFIINKAKLLGIFEEFAVAINTGPKIALKYMERKTTIKIDATNDTDAHFLQIPGVVSLDICICMLKIYTKAEKKSLKYFLEKCGLDGKENMPIVKMWRIMGRAMEGEEEAYEEMKLVAKYCCVDAQRCQDLIVKQNIINEYCETSALSYLSVSDSYQNAVGMRVKNLLGAYANREEYLFSYKHESGRVKEKFPGAYVFDPDKGLVPDPDKISALEAAICRVNLLNDSTEKVAIIEGSAREFPENQEYNELISAAKKVNHESAVKARSTFDEMLAKFRADHMEDVVRIDELYALIGRAKKHYVDPFSDPEVKACIDALIRDRPITGLDFSSLYPSLIMAYNLSPEKIVHDEATRDALLTAGKKLHEISFNMPIAGNIRAWSILHENDPNEIGLYPKILIDLFAKRAEMKKSMKRPAAIMDSINAFKIHLFKSDIAEQLKESLNKIETTSGGTFVEAKRLYERCEELKFDSDAIKHCFDEEFEVAEFDHSCADIKQKALKVCMNTFYGEAGNFDSPFYLLPFAGGVTSAGQYNIHLVEKFVKEQEFVIKYGDTDSLYIIPPPAAFQECDAEYVRGQIEYKDWMEKMVLVTMKQMGDLRNAVNAHLESDNGTKYLKMAYEEVLFPANFTGKKKYYGMAHEKIVNMFQTKFFMRGLELIKQGQSEYSKKITIRMLNRSMDIYNRTPMMRIVKDALKQEIKDDGRSYNHEDFVETASYKPEKKNVKVLTFVALLEEEHASEKELNRKTVEAGGDPIEYMFEPPEPGARFEFIITRPKSTVELNGTRSKNSVGGRMMYMKTAKALNYLPDISGHYIKIIVGICARFVNFEFPATTDVESQELAKKYLTAFIKEVNSDEVIGRPQLMAYKRAFKAASESFKGEQLVPYCSIEDIANENATKCIVDSAYRAAKELAETGKKAWCLSVAENFNLMENLYSFNLEKNQPFIQETQRIILECKNQIMQIMPKFKDASAIFAKRVNEFRVAEHKKDESLGEVVLNEIRGDPSIAREDVLELQSVWYKLVGVYMTNIRSSIIANYVTRLKQKRTSRTPIIMMSEKREMFDLQ